MNTEGQYIEFSNMNGIKFEEIDFFSANTEFYGPVVLSEKLGRSKGKPSSAEFKGRVIEAFRLDENTLLFCKMYIRFRADRLMDVYGFGYIEGGRIMPVKFKNSADLDAWIYGLTDRFRKDRDEEIDLVVELPIRGFGIGRNFGPSPLDETETYLNHLAPEQFLDEKSTAD